MAATSAFDREGQLPPPRRERAGQTGTLADATTLVPEEAMVYVTALMGTPVFLTEVIAQSHHRWQRLTTTSDYLLAPLATFDRPDDVDPASWPFHHVTVQPSKATSGLGPDRLRRVPAHSSSFYSLYRPGGPLAVDVALVQVSEPGPDGRFSLGVNGGAALEVVCSAEIVIAEVNPRMPYVAGPAAFERSAFDLLVEVEHELLSLEPKRPPDRPTGGELIAEYLAAEVPDGATLEYGIGAIPDAALAGLADHSNLGLHSGLIGDAAIDLIEAGALDGASKSVDTGLHVASAFIGTRTAAEWVRDRDDVVIVASNYSHGVPVLARQHRFAAINSAVEIALDGSVNAEQIGTTTVSGPGGQPDFAAGAALAIDGRSIVALTSTAGRGRFSRLVSRLDPAVPTTVPGYLADLVVTEFGVARLRGADLGQRAERLAAISHPDFRSQLTP